MSVFSRSTAVQVALVALMLMPLPGHAFLGLFRGKKAERVFVREVRFGPGERLRGQIERPTKPGSYPLVFLIPAGGGIDRFGTSSKLPAFDRIYDPIAKAATDNGWAIFRFDRQGTVGSTPSTPESVNDVLEALRTALDMPHVNRDRVVIIGHGFGTMQLRDNLDKFLEITGSDELKGTILLASSVDPATAAKIPADLLIILGESDSGDAPELASGAVSLHRRAHPDTKARSMVIPKSDHALCDTTGVDWDGFRGGKGTCRVSKRVYEEIARFLKRLERK
jgi:pimeloyl-ACP methyl ester carboxylesterase